ncbi:hypothetical protein GCM10007938_32970 [Vibrio zhanjiangensis]|uniref:Uncharacterized protein n=1 Tax=Vibrio zhanjiangensis TaxID=1046128 RepID=A0ABQ6F3T9_9VIBR|nr:hypothetical protein GCM10007938_32970 [Vibrio zhanjiangensis]
MPRQEKRHSKPGAKWQCKSGDQILQTDYQQIYAQVGRQAGLLAVRKYTKCDLDIGQF